MGKTYLIRRILRENPGSYILIDDYCGEYSEGVLIRSPAEFLKYYKHNKIFKSWSHSEKFIFDLAFRIGQCFPVILVLDEASHFGHFNPYLEEIYCRGRHWQVAAIASAQRIYSLPPVIRSQTQKWYLFQIIEPADLDYCRRVFGFIPDVDTVLKSLKPHEFIDINL